MTYKIDIRPRRQVTIPKAVLEQLDLKVGDSLVAEVQGKEVRLKPQKQVALDAFKALQKIFKNSKTSLNEMLAEIDRQRAKEVKNG